MPAFGKDPEGWLDATLEILRPDDVLLPTQEQLTILARDRHRIDAALAVPSFASVLRVQDKVAQARTLQGLGLPLPPTTILEGPLHLKEPIGTASTGVRRHDADLVAQQHVPGPLAMVQAIFDRGRLVAHHANLREREGANGGSATKRSIALPEAAAHLTTLGDELQWHGALSLDAIVTSQGPLYIDVNPRLVEPGNAYHAGTDLVAALIDVSLGRTPVAQRSRAGVVTRQRLVGVLGAGTRREVWREATAPGPDELTPTRGDPRAAIPLIAATVAALVTPRVGRHLATGAVASYALTPQAWDHIRWQNAPKDAKLPRVDR